MKNNFKIIKADLSYLDKFYKLFEESLRQRYFLYPPNSSDYIVEKESTKIFFKENLEKKDHILYLALNDKEPIGYLFARVSKDGLAFGHWLGVLKKYQHRGTGSNLLAFWEKHALKEGAHKLWLWTTENNLDFYKRVGFTLGGGMPEAWYGVDHFLFYKTLRKSNEKNFLKDYLKNKNKK